MPINNAKELNECLCCGSERLKLVLDLNEQPLANSFKKTAEEAEPTFPLRLNICEECTHLQLSHAVDPDLCRHRRAGAGTAPRRAAAWAGPAPAGNRERSLAGRGRNAGAPPVSRA